MKTDRTGSPLSALGNVEVQRFSPIAPGQSPLEFIEQWAIPICGSLVALELISRLLACRTPEVSQRACYFGGGAYLLVALIPVYLGLIDYGQRRIGIGERMDLTGDTDADIAYIREYYEGVDGRWPEKASPVLFT